MIGGVYSGFVVCVVGVYVLFAVWQVQQVPVGCDL